MAALSGSLEAWIERQYRSSVADMLRSVSPTGIEKRRPFFDQSVRARRGAIVASPVLGGYDPDPDYFFHWYRDSAVVADALRLVQLAGRVPLDTRPHLAEFVEFSSALAMLDGRTTPLPPPERVAPDYRRFVRDRAELDQVHGPAVALDTRVNPDGSLDILRWSRPQADGPALRALTLLRWRRDVPLEDEVRAALERLLRADLEQVLEFGARPSFDLWEEERALHYYTLRVSAAALLEGADFLTRRGETRGSEYRAEAQRLLTLLDAYWDPALGYYQSRREVSGAGDARKRLDVAVLIGVVHADAPSGPHSAGDPRIHATLAALEQLFDARYAINRDRGSERGVALGRYDGDVYYAGGAYFFATLAAAELAFGAARHEAARARDPEARAWMARGDAHLSTVRAYTPADGSLAEQFDQRTGAPASARHLAWSYAAFISAIAARDAACAMMHRNLPSGGGRRSPPAAG